MRFDTYIPCDRLKPYVKTIAVQESEQIGEYKILPDTSLVIGFQFYGKLSYLQDNSETALSTSGITGLHDRYRIFKNTSPIGSVLVYFKEAGAAAFFKQPLNELFRESVSLENFMLRSELLILEEQLQEAKTDHARISVVETFLISKLMNIPSDQMVLMALALIHKSKGTIRIVDLARELNTSQSPLEKRFRKVVGVSPKKFASLVRIKHVLQQYQPENSLTELGYESGYYDQAHFIKEFKTFTGESPEKFFKGV